MQELQIGGTSGLQLAQFSGVEQRFVPAIFPFSTRKKRRDLIVPTGGGSSQIVKQGPRDCPRPQARSLARVWSWPQRRVSAGRNAAAL